MSEDVRNIQEEVVFAYRSREEALAIANSVLCDEDKEMVVQEVVILSLMHPVGYLVAMRDKGE